MPWRILIVDDFPAVRQYVRALLETFPEFQVCGEAENGQQGIEKARELNPDIEIAGEIAFFEPGDGRRLLGPGAHCQNGEQVRQDQPI